MARGKPAEHKKKIIETKARISALKEQITAYDAVSDERHDLRLKALETEELFINKYLEKLEEMEELMGDIEEEETNIQKKWKEVSKDIIAVFNLA
jgi:hypothetical protein